MRIVYFTEYSWPNTDGVWMRVYNEAKYFMRKGHRVFAFSNDIFKGSGKLKSEESYDGIKICRFPVKRITENASFWPTRLVSDKLSEIKPEIIVCNNRHPEVKIALRYSKSNNIPCVLVTHAPFLEKGIRSPLIQILTWIYDKTLNYNQFDKIIAITKWEIPYLIHYGVRKEKIFYGPNTVNDSFFKNKKTVKKCKKFIFLGRIVEIKDIETILFALDKEKVELIGPVSEDYKKKLSAIIQERKLNVKFTEPIFNLNKKIKKLLSADAFILPSKREGLPQSLLEAMSLGLIPIASSNQGAKEVVNKKNGFLFNIGDIAGLRKILHNLNKQNLISYSNNAKKTAENFRESKIMCGIERLYLSLVNTK
jgi:glycosyltransferase involved in cell wall biosynthesis